VKYGKRSRVDFLLQSEGQRRCYLEIKSVHMMRKPGLAEFPDAVTTRGAKHLRELAAETRRGSRAVMLFVVQVGSAQSVSIARDIDPAYKAAFDWALSSGVEVFALTCRVTTEGIEVAQPIPVLG
jgi:sugar fermentation stimulation protein A